MKDSRLANASEIVRILVELLLPGIFSQSTCILYLRLPYSTCQSTGGRVSTIFSFCFPLFLGGFAEEESIGSFSSSSSSVFPLSLGTSWLKPKVISSTPSSSVGLNSTFISCCFFALLLFVV